MSDFNFAAIRSKLNKIVEFDEDSFSKRGITHLTHGFTEYERGSKPSTLWLRIKLKFSDSYDYSFLRGADEIALEGIAYDKEGNLADSASHSYDMRGFPWLEFDSQRAIDFEKISVSLVGGIPKFIEDPSVLQIGQDIGGTPFEIDTKSFGDRALAIASYGSTVSKSTRTNDVTVLLEINNIPEKKSPKSSIYLNVLVYSHSGSLIGVSREAISSISGMLYSRLVKTVVKIAKDEDIGRIKLYLD